MCGRLVNLDTVARVLADYYHLKTDAQLAALDEALSRVPAVSVGGGYRKDHVVDPGNMVGDLISRQAAIEVIEAGRLTKLIDAETAVNGLKALPSAKKKGHWIDEGTNYACSECHRGCWVNSNYCPWCGAKMDGKDGDHAEGTIQKERS